MHTSTVGELAQALNSNAVAVIDVREPYEFASGHVPGAINIPMATIPVRLADLPRDRAIHVICESGARSWQVCAYLDRQGIQTTNIEGGTAVWRTQGLPLDTGSQVASA
jgi:rhodanese-related sulfurtransferase